MERNLALDDGVAVVDHHPGATRAMKPNPFDPGNSCSMSRDSM